MYIPFYFKFKFFRFWLAVICLIIGVKEVLKSPLVGESCPNEYFIDVLPILQPNKITCGPTSVAMVLTAYQKPLPLQMVICHTHTVWFNWNGPYGMTMPQRIAGTLKRNGVPAQMGRGNLEFLKSKVSQDKPCVVLLRSGELRWHYVVVIGYDLEYIFFADPGEERIQMLTVEHFMDSWNWEKDTNGEICSLYFPITILKMLDVYPRTIIFPTNGIFHEQNINVFDVNHRSVRSLQIKASP